MHIAMYVAAWPPGTNSSGILTYAHTLKSELERIGHRLSIFTGKVDEADLGNDVHKIHVDLPYQIRQKARRIFSSKMPSVFQYGELIAKTIKRIHATDPFDVIEIEESFGFCETVARALPVPVVVKLHGPAFLTTVDEERDNLLSRERIRREGEALSMVAGIMAPARCTLDQTLTHYRLTPAVKAHVENPLTLDTKAPLWNITACDKKTILFVGRFDRAKGADAVLAAFGQLVKNEPDLKLLFVGPDNGLPLADGTLAQFESYCQTVFSESDRKKINFFGRLKSDEINALRTQALITIVASRWENQSYATLEAMLQGCPVVCVDTGGQKELIQHSKNGLLARKDDIADLSKNIQYLLDHPDIAESYGAQAREYALSHHAPTTVAYKTLAFYQCAIDAYKANPARN